MRLPLYPVRIMSSSDQIKQPYTIDCSDIVDRIAALDWADISSELDAHGCAVIGPLLTPEQCAALAGLYDMDGIFRSRVVMARHGFGRGEYNISPIPCRR